MANNSINIPVTSNKYVSVVIPAESDYLNSTDTKPSIKDLVFESQKDALQLLKKYKNSRFKVFDNYDDAFNFSLEHSFQEEKSFIKQDDDFTLTLNPELESFNSNFKGPSNPELAKFRKMIQNNELESIQSLLTNPRYLINSCETPVLLMEGPRYNALHIAVKSNRSNILKLILNLLKDRKYMKKLFHLDDDNQIQDRIEHIVDLYLNTPDKGLHDTPLHLACKFGCYECVEILLNEPQCIKEMKNKNDKVPYDVICDRVSNDELKKRIQNLFFSKLFVNYYIPIIRENEFVSVGEPQSNIPSETKRLSALAGPMAKELAVDLYERLKSPRTRSREEIAIRLSDDSKGVERIARIQCKQNSVNWKEYWPFLEDYVDLQSEEGLKKLENHLKNIQKKLNADEFFKLLCERMNNLYIDSDGDIFYTAPSTPIEDGLFLNGNSISDYDIDAALALQDALIDPYEYPLITKWLDLVSNHIKESNKTKIKVALQLPNLNRSLNFSSLSFNSSNGEISILNNTANESVYLKSIISPNKLIEQNL